MINKLIKNIFEDEGKRKSIDDIIEVGDEPIRITKSEYKKRLVYPHNIENPVTKDSKKDAKERAKRAFEFAIETRKFEIEMYWKRASYFWAFITVTFGGYVALIRSDKSANFEALLLICIGLIVSLAWHLTNVGSKTWQRHWEKHLDLLEDEFMGPLYKTVNINTTYSVSKINEIVSFVFVLAWIILGLNHLYVENPFNSENPNWHSTILVVSSILLVTFAVFRMFFGKGRGRFKAQEVKMYKRGYVYSYEHDNNQ